MVDSFDEIEIKIEYNESFETDPLCHEIHISNDFIGIPKDSQKRSAYTTPESVLTEPKKDSHDELADWLYVAKNQDICCKHGLGGYRVPAMENEGATKTTQTTNWYKSIDGFGNYVCSFCERTYTCITTLRYHVNVKHKEEAITVKTYINKKRRNSKHKCHLCRSRFSCITTLKDHVENVHGFENIAKSCLLCNGSFNTLEELSNHLLCYHNVRHKNIFICKVCGYRTHRAHRFVQHKDVHMERKYHKCQFCDYCTNHLYNLKSHEKIHGKAKLQNKENTGE